MHHIVSCRCMHSFTRSVGSFIDICIYVTEGHRKSKLASWHRRFVYVWCAYFYSFYNTIIIPHSAWYGGPIKGTSFLEDLWTFRGGGGFQGGLQLGTHSAEGREPLGQADVNNSRLHVRWGQILLSQKLFKLFVTLLENGHIFTLLFRRGYCWELFSVRIHSCKCVSICVGFSGLGLIARENFPLCECVALTFMVVYMRLYVHACCMYVCVVCTCFVCTRVYVRA